jgi:hypothetical protein
MSLIQDALCGWIWAVRRLWVMCKGRALNSCGSA